MPIVQHDPQRPNLAVRIDQGSASCLVVEPFAGGPADRQVLDLTPYQGGPFRLYLEQDGRLSTELEGDHYWLLAEAILPEPQWEMTATGEVDEYGQTRMVMRRLPLDLNAVEVRVWPLPEVG